MQDHRLERFEGQLEREGPEGVEDPEWKDLERSYLASKEDLDLDSEHPKEGGLGLGCFQLVAQWVVQWAARLIVQLVIQLIVPLIVQLMVVVDD